MKKAVLCLPLIVSAGMLFSCNSTTPASMAAEGVRHPYIGDAVPADAEVTHTVHDALVYLYPLIEMERSRQILTNVSAADDNGYAPVNQFGHRCIYPDAGFRSITYPDVDMFYSSAFLDLQNGPMVVSMPDEMGRYYQLSFLDAWGRSFSMVSSSGMANYVITGSGWRGELPRNMKQIVAPGSGIWISCRTQVNDKTDGEIVKHLQRRYNLIPLAKWNDPIAENLPVNSVAPQRISRKPVADMTVDELINTANKLMLKNPPYHCPTALREEMDKLNIGPGKQFSSAAFDLSVKKALEALPKQVAREIALLHNQKEPLKNKWQLQTASSFGPDCLGARLTEDVVVLTTEQDTEGKQLAGSGNYKLHFTRGQLPESRALWSLTMYGKDHYLVANSTDRFAVSDRDRLLYNADGSLDIYIQRSRPDSAAANWLPAPEGVFSLSMRIYGCKGDKKQIGQAIPAVARAAS